MECVVLSVPMVIFHPDHKIYIRLKSHRWTTKIGQHNLSDHFGRSFFLTETMAVPHLFVAVAVAPRPLPGIDRIQLPAWREAPPQTR